MCSLRYSICTGTRCSQVLGVHRVKRVNYPYILGHFADYAPHKTLYMHLVYSCALNEQGTQLTPQSSIDPYLPCSAAVKFHNITYTPCNIPYRPSTPKFCTQARQAICAMLSIATTLFIAATHNITHSPCTSTCTTHPATPTTLPSTTLLCTQLTNTKHIGLSGGKMAQDVGMV